MIIDAHAHLWETQRGLLNGKAVYALSGGRSNFGGEVRQMLPPYLYDGRNLAEALVSNMDYAGVSGCVITQEYIDGNQDEYLLHAKSKFPEQLKICSLYEENADFRLDGFGGIKICAGRLKNPDLSAHSLVFKKAEENNKFISIDMAEGSLQTGALEEIIQECPNLKVAIGHFGMVTRERWQEQIKLARYKNVYIESGGITWLFHGEFYPYESAVRAILQAGAICGMEKLMWGSDYPRTMTAITYKMSLDFIEKSVLLTPEEKEQFLGENAKTFYGFLERDILTQIKNMVE